MPVDHERILRYRKQSLQLLESAFNQMRSGRWSRSEDLLWGSLTLAVKAVALSRGEQPDGEEAVREYAGQLGRERRDRRIREAFSQLAEFGDSVERIRESRFRFDRLIPILARSFRLGEKKSHGLLGPAISLTKTRRFTH